MPKSIDAQRDKSAAIIKELVAEGWEPTEIIGVTINASLLLAGMTDAQCGYASSDNYSVLISQVGHEEEAIGFIREQIAKDKESELRAMAEARIEAGGTNVFSILKNK